jgi:alkylation response protein AidB-like acyl-CoA dehydrogenase
VEARAALFEKGVTQIAHPAKYGGLGLPFGVYELAMELVGTADASIALSMAIHNTVAEGLIQFGSEGLRSQLIPDIMSGKKLASFSLTEPTSGSDAKAINTRARRVGNDYVLNGSKAFITNAGEADLYFVFASTEKGPSAFVVDRTSPGIQFGSDLPKLGMRGSRTAEVRFADCRVPRDMLVGEEGKGFDYAKSMLNGSRIVMGSICTGIAQAAFDEALAYSKQRRAFGSPISEFQLTKEKIADMKTGISAGRLMCIHASRVRESGGDYASEASQAKVFATETSLKVCDAAIQIFGGHGYTTDDVHRHWRDARLLTIGEGTSEVLRMLIARKELARSL